MKFPPIGRRGRDLLLALVGGVMGASMAVVAMDLPPVLHPASHPPVASAPAGHRTPTAAGEEGTQQE
ncbi:MAG: hypothetical protein ACRDZY_11360 [Acidimicrobiales bacterium]